MKHRRWLLLAASSAAVLGFWSIPVVHPETAPSTVLLDRYGGLLGATVADDEQWRFPSSHDSAHDVPPKFAVALKTFEDRRFDLHPGVDPLAVLRALWTNLRAGRVRSGASTLTMQTVRISRGNPPRTVVQKLIEMALALRLEGSTSKSEVLSMYSSNAPFGGNVVGLDAAAWRYFGRESTDLSWAESATLAVLPNSPALIHPGRNRSALKRKRDRLLDALATAGHLDASDLGLAKAEPLPSSPHDIPQLAPHLLMKARARGEHHRTTTLDRGVQERAQRIVARHGRSLAANGVHNAAALVVEVETGDVIAYIGNTGTLRDFDHHNHVDIVQAPRSTGSTLKPFLYGAMVQRGELMPTQLVPDIPTHLGGFSPENYDRRFDGALPAPQALARSRNIPAVRMLRQYGVDRFQGQLTRMGMTTLHREPSDYGLALILGGSEATLWELTSLYRSLAWSAAHPEGGPLPSQAWRPHREADNHLLLDPGAAYLTLQALLEVNRPGVDSVWETFDSSQPIAWKTGTSFGFRDAWAIGVTPRYAIGVWVGNATGEGRPNLTGFTSAAPILFDLFDMVDDGDEWFAEPTQHLRQVRVCARSGHTAGPDCADAVLQSVPRTASPGPPCPYCERIHLDPDEDLQVTADCESVGRMRHQSWFSLPPDMAWFHARRNPAYLPKPPYRRDCIKEKKRRYSLLYPAEDSTVYVPVELDGSRGRVVFEATHQDRDATLFWHVDDAFVRSTTEIHQVALDPAPGPHLLTLVDASGVRLVRRFTVLGTRQP